VFVDAAEADIAHWNRDPTVLALAPAQRSRAVG
jgi:hypothetical protein